MKIVPISKFEYKVFPIREGSLLDYRAKTGESRNVLLLAERSPTCDVERVAKFLRTDTSEVFRLMSEK